MKKAKEFEYLIDAFKSLPGMGKKNATRCAFFLINKDAQYQKEFAKRILDASNNLTNCKYCNNISNQEVCTVCSDQERFKQVCVVESVEDMERIEQSKNYFGLYYIIGNTNSVKNFKLADINLEPLFNQINDLSIKEVIIATSFSLIGEALSEYVKSNIQKKLEVPIFRLGFGIPLNVNIDYIDDETIRESLLNKKKIN
ncbi:MAG: recombination mediator RecR [Mycoplasma sp.]